MSIISLFERMYNAVDKYCLEPVTKAIEHAEKSEDETPEIRTSGDYARFITHNTQTFRSVESDSRIVL